MKKIITLLMTAVLYVSTMSAVNYENIKIGDLYYNLYDSYQYWDGLQQKYITEKNCAVVISNPSQYAGKVIIPATVQYNDKTFDVKFIGSSAFGNCSNLTAITIPSSVKTIFSSAFDNCSSLGAVHISDLTAWCNIYFGSGDSNPLNYAHHLFMNNEELTDIVIPEGITAIKPYTFYNCTGLKSVTLPSTLTSIGYYAFYNSSITSIDIPEGVTTISEDAFFNCQNLKSVTIPSSLTQIGSSAFGNCSALAAVHISDLSKWCQIAFNSNSANPCNYAHHLYLNGEEITELVLPSDITVLKQYAFYGCSYLTSIVVPDNYTNIPSQAFYNCTKVNSISLGANLEYLNQDVFSTFSNLQSIHWNVKNCVDFGNASLSVLYSKRNKITSFTFGESVEHIPAYLCYEMSNLQKIDIPANVKSVGEGAFAFCTRLAEFNAAAGSPIYTSVDGVLFNKDKTSLIIYPAGKAATSYTVPSGVKTIEENAFYGCVNLSSVTIPASVTSIKAGNAIVPMWSFAGTTPASIAESAFAEDAYLIVDNVDTYKAAWPAYASRIFPREHAEKNLTLTAKSDKSALHMAIGDTNLEYVIKLTISGTINSYDLMIMRNKMINLRELDLTNASIEANAYEYYTGFCSHADTLLEHSFRDLRSIKLPRTLKYAEKAMIDCPDLKYAEFNGGVIGTQVAPYKGDGDLQVVLNEGVTEIKPYAFVLSNNSHRYYYDSDLQSYTNSKLHAISLPNSLGKVEAQRFWYCRNLQEVTLGNALTEIGDYAFCECPALTSIVLPEALESIGNFAFQGTKIAEITIPSGVRRIGNGAFLSAFSNSNNGTRITLATDLGWYNSGSSAYMYYNGTLTSGSLRNNGGYSTTAALRKVTFAADAKLNEIGVCAFAFSKLEEIVIPDSVATIGQFAFVGSHQLKSVKFGEKSKLSSIARGVFQNCDGLETMILPAELTNIGELAFSSHTAADALKEIAIPSKLKSIDRAAFYGRKGLEKISFPTSLQTIGDYAFQGCTGLDEIKVPSTLLSVGNYAFSDCSNVTKVYTYTVEPVNIDQNTFSCWHNADLYVPSTSYYTYFYNTQWSQFLSLKQFDEAYEYFYINNDYELGGGNGTIDGKPDADLNENSGLIVTGDSAQQVGIITIAGDENGAASIIACEENLKADSLVIRLITQKGIWSYFCFPFDIALEQLSFAHKYVIREYNGATRAQYGAGGWMNMVGTMLQKGLGYIFQGAQTDTLQITIKNPKIGCQDYEQLVKAHSAENAIHANWNFIGNPFPSWYDLDALFAGGFSSPVYIWDTKTQDYKVYKPGDDEYHFHPYEGFFTQNPNGQDMNVRWPSDGRETKTQADNKHHNHAPARKAQQEASARKIVNIRLSSDAYTDRARIVFNDEASMEYELGRDAIVMGGQAPLHIWSINGANRLAINERPYGTGFVSLGYEVIEDGFYTLSASRMDTAVILYDNVLQQEVDLAQGDYVFSTEAGVNTTRFSIARIKAQEENTTGIDEAVVNPNEIVNVYNMLGVKVLDNVRRGDINLNSGIYVVENQNGAKTELNIQ